MRFIDFLLPGEVADEYIELRRTGNCRSAATEELKKRYVSEITQGAIDDGLLFWIGLADGQYKRKELSSEVAVQAIRALDLLQQSGWEITPSDIVRRRLHYAEAPMPEQKVGKPRPKYRCTWKNGDTFAYMLSGTYAEELSVDGQYILLHKVSDIEFSDGRLLPVVILSLWEKDSLPQTAEQFLTVPFLRIDRGRFGLPRNLYEYRVEIVMQSEKQLSALHLQYLGNFQNIKMPDDEVIINNSGDMAMTLPEVIDRDFCIYIKMDRRYANNK